MKGLVLFVCCIAWINASPYLDWFSQRTGISIRNGKLPDYYMRREFEKFKAKHSKKYQSVDEEDHRYHIFSEHYHELVKFDYERIQLGMHNYTVDFNENFDRRKSGRYSIEKLLLGQPFTCHRTGYPFRTSWPKHLPDAVDWRLQGYVTPVKNRGEICEPCWAFSAIGSLEGQHYRKTGKLVPLSVQNLIDCIKGFIPHACIGGSIEKAFEYINYNGGIDTEASYPYEDTAGICRYKQAERGAQVAGFVNVPATEERLKEAVSTIGPISAAVDGSHISFQLYKSGVYFEPKCNSTALNRAVLVVGYGTERGQDYWLIKNSIGESWGEGGYMKLARNRDNHCGIATCASYPLV